MAQKKKKKKSRGKNNKSRTQDADGGIIRVRLPEEGEVLGQVIQMLGGRLMLVRCTDEKVRQIHIPGKHRRRMWTRQGDIVITMPRYGLNPDEKGDLVYRYKQNEIKVLLEKELIPEEFVF